MGWQTYNELKVQEGEDGPILTMDEAFKKFPAIQRFMDLDQDQRFPVWDEWDKWYEPDSVDAMLDLSRAFPNLLFIVEREDEDHQYQWREYSKNGMRCELEQQRKWPEFDEGMLRLPDGTLNPNPYGEEGEKEATP